MRKTFGIWGLWVIGLGCAAADVPPAAPPPPAEEALQELRVDVTCVVPAEGPSVERGRLVARFFEYDPRVADRAATELARVELTGMSHRTGTETVLRFPCAGETAVRKAYYLTIVIYPADGGADQAGLYFIDGFQRVLMAGPREELRVTLAPVGTGAGPTN